MNSYEKLGYLNSEFRLFHLTDTKKHDFDYHYHDFDKIIIFIRGDVDYLIEGKSYALQPYDIVLVNHNEIHRPVIDPSQAYERIIVYLSPGFITSYRTESYDLSSCFQQARENKSSVLRIRSLKKSQILQTIHNLEYASTHQGYAGELYCQVLFLEFMIHLNRAALGSLLEYLRTDSCNPKILELLDYMNHHLSSDLSIDFLAGQCFLSKYHMMRLFKEETGYTIGAYITNKRLLAAKEMLGQDKSITQICFECGFQNYSTFSRAYKSMFGESPKMSLPYRHSK